MIQTNEAYPPLGVCDLPQADHSDLNRSNHPQEKSHPRGKAAALMIFIAVSVILAITFGISKNNSNSNSNPSSVFSSEETKDQIGTFNEKENNVTNDNKMLTSKPSETEGLDTLADGTILSSSQEKNEEANDESTIIETSEERAELNEDAYLRLDYNEDKIKSKSGIQSNDVPRPPNNLNETCSENVINTSESAMEACVSDCSPAACCFSESDGFLGFTLGECFSQNVIFCTQHMPCSVLFDEVTENIPPAPKDLIETCDPLNSKFSSACEDACSPGSCCFSESEDPENYLGFELGECFVENFKSCSGYIPCTIAYIFDDEEAAVPVPPEGLEELCATDDAQTKRGKSIACQSVCAPATCCTSTDPDFSCSGSANCDAYAEHCVEVDIFENFPPPTDGLEHICAFRHIAGSSEKWEACESECAKAACCNIPQFDAEEDSEISATDLISFAMDTCLLGNPIGCSYYLPCLALNRVPNPAGGNVVIEYADATIDDICSIQNVIFGTGREECKSMCEPAACCDPTLEDSCVVANVFACSSYLQCATLKVNGDDNDPLPEDELDNQGDGDTSSEDVLTIPVPSEEYFEACSFLSITIDDVPCKAMCSEVSCCDNNTNDSCYTDNKEACDMYKKCRRVNSEISFGI